MMGLMAALAAISALSLSGWRRTMASPYWSSVRTVSSSDSPLRVLECDSLIMTHSPPRRFMAASKEDDVRVDGSKNMEAEDAALEDVQAALALHAESHLRRDGEEQVKLVLGKLLDGYNILSFEGRQCKQILKRYRRLGLRND